MPIDVNIHAPVAALAESKDVITLVVAVSAVIVTILAVHASYVLGRKYMEHVDEIGEISDKYRATEEDYRNTRDVYLRLTKHLELAFHTIVRKDEVESLLADVAAAQADLKSSGTLYGVQVPAKERSQREKAVAEKITALQAKREARRFELLCLSSQYPVSLNHVRYLAQFYGDKETIKFLKLYLPTITSPDEQNECREAIGALEYRLGAGASQPPLINSTLWTGD